MESGSQGFVNVAIEVDLFFPPLGLYLEAPQRTICVVVLNLSPERARYVRPSDEWYTYIKHDFSCLYFVYLLHLLFFSFKVSLVLFSLFILLAFTMRWGLTCCFISSISLSKWFFSLANSFNVPVNDSFILSIRVKQIATQTKRDVILFVCPSLSKFLLFTIASFFWFSAISSNNYQRMSNF